MSSPVPFDPRMLRFAAWFCIVVGALMVLVTAAVPGAMLALAAIVFPSAPDAAVLSPYARLAVGIAGGLLAGWGMTFDQLAAAAQAIDGAAVRRAGLRGVWTWFILDSFGSVAAGGHFNVIGNLVFLGLFLVAFRRPSPPTAPSPA